MYFFSTYIYLNISVCPFSDLQGELDDLWTVCMEVCNFSVEEAVVKEVWMWKRCVSPEEERCLVAKTNPVVLFSCSLTELPS